MRTTFSVLSSRTRLDLVGEARSSSTCRPLTQNWFARVDRDDRLVLRVGLVDGVTRLGQLDGDALLQHRRDQHHDDEQHQHDVDERRHVDVGLETAFGCRASIAMGLPPGPSAISGRLGRPVERTGAADWSGHAHGQTPGPTDPYAVFLMK